MWEHQVVESCIEFLRVYGSLSRPQPPSLVEFVERSSAVLAGSDLGWTFELEVATMKCLRLERDCLRRVRIVPPPEGSDGTSCFGHGNGWRSEGEP